MGSPSADIQLISRSSFAFSTALHEQLQRHAGDENLIFSPLSLAMVLLMARFGARGNTAAELDKVLKFTTGAEPLDLDELIPFRHGFFQLLTSLQDPKTTEFSKVTVANRLFTNEGLNIHKEFTNITKAVLNIDVRQLDFAKDKGRSAADIINSWASRITNGKINEIVSSDSLTDQTQLLLVNAIHFKSPWDEPFDPESTRAETFHLNSKESVKVDIMFAEGRYSYAKLEGLDAQLAVIPYKGGQFSMHVYIPREIDGLSKFIQALRNVSMEEIRSNIKTPGICEEVHLHLPKFKIRSAFNLVRPLREMGARDMFSMFGADFSGITSDDVELYVSDVVQKAFIEVNEEGTEAAAVSGIQAGVTCMPSVTTLTADRPFYFQIVAENSDVVLFAGVVRSLSETQKTHTASTEDYSESEQDSDPRIFFATRGGGIKVYSGESENADRIVDTKENLYGVTYDSANQLIYFSSSDKIYRAKTDGSIAKAVVVCKEYSGIRGLAFDYVTGNLYGVTKGGTIFVCKKGTAGLLECVTVLSGLRTLSGIALDPINGTMYWTERGSIMSAGMDGSEPVEIFRDESSGPLEILVDMNSSRLVWTDSDKNRIQSSNFDGSDVQTVVSLPRGYAPYGITLHGNKIYWSNYGTNTLQSSDRSGKNVRKVYSGTDRILGLSSVNTNDPIVPRQNDCSGQKCPSFCVLSRASSRCLP